jgi:D-glycero-D-manno-heptose 1,7-bisphosphate phosphatase
VGEHEVNPGGGAERRAVLLDRDGTLIDVVRDSETGTISTAFHPSQVVLLGGVVEGLRLLRDAGYVFGIATNQPGPAKGQFTADAVRRTNDALVALLAQHGLVIERVETCMHHPEGGPPGSNGDASLVGPCDCRKPRPGLIETLVRELGASRSASWMVGDSAADVEAGAAAKVRTALVFPGNRCELCPLRHGVEAASKKAVPTVHGATLLAVAREILRQDAA